MLRKEDARFLQGRGNYLDDITMPGMLYGAVLGSPYAHARIVSIDTSAAEAHPKVRAVITGQMLEGLSLAWMPTLSADVQAVLATDKVRYQGQEVAFVIADDRYSARDVLELIDVEYEALAPMIDARRALDADAPLVRDEIEGRTDNRIFDWESGDKAATDAAFAGADVTVGLDVLYPRSHPAPMETCGSLAYMDPVTGKLTAYITSQAPHAHRTVYALVAGIPEHKIQVISPDIGGGFGNKVPIYPGYVLAVVGSIVTKRPVKWMEDRSSNLMTTGFARDYHMHGEIAATKDGKILGVRVDVIADHGAFNATAQPTKYPAGFFHIFTGSYDYAAAHCKVTGVYTNKAPGGVAYACSFRITEAVYLIERIVDRLAVELGTDPAELRMKNLLRPEQFPYTTPTGWEYDSGDYPRALQEAMRIAGYDELRREQAERREQAAASGDPTSQSYMGIGVAFFTEGVGAGPRKHMDILGLGMADGCDLRVHPTGKAQLRLSVQSQGQGHETTFAQIVSHQLGIPPEDVEVIHGDTDNTPFGLGTYGSRSTPVSGAAAAVVSQRVRDKARLIAAAALECDSEDLEWAHGRWQVVGDPTHGKSIAEIAMLAHSNLELPDGVEGHLDAQVVYNPPNLTYPFGAYICVVDVDAGHRCRQGAPLHRRRRLRPTDQPDDRRGADPRRARRRHRHGADAGDHVRRGRQLPRRLVHGLPAADVDGGAQLRARRDGDAVAAPSTRGQGRRRVGDSGFAACGRQRRHRRVATVRREARRHAADAGPGVAGDPGPPGANGSRLHVNVDVSARADGLRDAARAVRPRPRRAGRDGRPAPIPATRRSCSPTGRSRASSGGDCAESTVRAQALALLDSGESVVLRITPDAEDPVAGQADGAQPVPQRRDAGDLPRAAPTGAALAVYGDSPIAGARGRSVRRSATRSARWAMRYPRCSAVVVASHGRDEAGSAHRSPGGRASTTSAWSRAPSAALLSSPLSTWRRRSAGARRHARRARHRRQHARGGRRVDRRRHRRASSSTVGPGGRCTPPVEPATDLRR